MNDPDRRRSPDGCDDDAIFADIVAHLREEAEDDEPAGPAEQGSASETETADQAIEQSTADPTEGSNPDPTVGSRPNSSAESTPDSTGEDPQAVPPPQVWRAHEVDDAHEEHFEPPPVTPLPAGDLQFWAILAGMGGGPALLLYIVFFNREVSSFWILAALAMSIGGFIMLVARIPDHHEDDDDGARL